jgi:hypothetical protein
MTKKTFKTFDGDRNDWVRIEEYADSVISGILETANFGKDNTGSCDTVIDLFRDYVIWTINPNYFWKKLLEKKE